MVRSQEYVATESPRTFENIPWEEKLWKTNVELDSGLLTRKVAWNGGNPIGIAAKSKLVPETESVKFEQYETVLFLGAPEHP